MFPCSSAVELIDPDLLPAQVVRVPRVVLDVKPEISRALLGLLHRGVRQRERQTQKMKKHKETDGESSSPHRC